MLQWVDQVLRASLFAAENPHTQHIPHGHGIFKWRIDAANPWMTQGLHTLKDIIGQALTTTGFPSNLEPVGLLTDGKTLFPFSGSGMIWVRRWWTLFVTPMSWDVPSPYHAANSAEESKSRQHARNIEEPLGFKTAGSIRSMCQGIQVAVIGPRSSLAIVRGNASQTL